MRILVTGGAGFIGSHIVEECMREPANEEVLAVEVDPDPGHCDQIRAGKPVPPAATYASPRPGDLRSSLLDARKIQRELGWHPQVTLAEGLRRTAAWFAGRKN